MRWWGLLGGVTLEELGVVWFVSASRGMFGGCVRGLAHESEPSKSDGGEREPSFGEREDPPARQRTGKDMTSWGRRPEGKYCDFTRPDPGLQLRSLPKQTITRLLLAWVLVLASSKGHQH